MQGNNHSIIVSVLRKDFPDVSKSIDEIITLKMPDFVLKDFSQMKSIIDAFVETVTEKDNIAWRHSNNFVLCELSKSDFRSIKVTDLRDMLMAVLLMFYQPERLLAFGDEKVRRKNGIVKEATSIMDCYAQDVAKSVVKSIIFYKSYSSFREEVDVVYQSIKNKLFAN